MLLSDYKGLYYFYYYYYYYYYYHHHHYHYYYNYYYYYYYYGYWDRIPVGARFSTPVQTGPGAHPASYTVGTGSLFQGQSGRCVTLTTHHL